MLARAIVVMTLSAGAGAACASGASTGQGSPTEPSATATQKTMSGQVTYRQRIALPPGAVLEVSLDDVSVADAPAQRLGSTTITTKGENVPIPFRLTYDASAVQPQRSYAVSARISIEGQLRWVSGTRHPVLTGGHPTDGVTITVDQVQPQTVSSEGSQPEEESLVGRWQLQRIDYGEGKSVTPRVPEKYRVEFRSGGSLAAQLDCNRGSGAYSVSETRLKVDPILATLMACGDDSIAPEFTKALQTAISFRRTNDTLILSMPNGAGTMHMTLLR